MIRVTVKNRRADAVPLTPVTSGSVGLPVGFIFSDDWEGLTKTAVFKGSGEERDVLLVENACTVPHEVLADPYGMLEIGVYGANGAGTVVIPTVWAIIQRIEPGTEVSGVEPAEPTPDMWAQMSELAQTVGAANAAAAAQSAEDAADSAVDAAASATAADNSATNAAQSATAASGSAGEAASSATAAAQSATSAAQSAAAAADSASDSATSATASGVSATNAAQSATSASGSAAAAGNQATAAAGAATQAAGSASAAATARTGAESAQTAAETAQGLAETAQGLAEDAKTAAETAQAAAEDAADRAEDALGEFTTPTASATTLTPGSTATATYSDGHFTFGIPKGDPGVTYALIPSAGFIVKNPNTGAFAPSQLVIKSYKIINGTSTQFSAAYIGANIYGRSMVPHYEVLNGNSLTVPISYISDTGYVECTMVASSGVVASVTIPCVLDGKNGEGVAPSGTTGQLLAKASDEDYDTEWIDQPEMDAGHVSYDSTETYSDGTVGKELGTINSALSSLQSVTEIIDTASGAIASFPDCSGLPMRSLLAQINPVQDLHGYDAPWAAGAGKNIVPPMTETVTKNGVTFTPDSEGCVAVSGTSTAITATASGIFEVKAGVSYTLNGCPSGGGTSSYRLDLRDASNPNQLDQELQSYLDSGSGVSFTPSTTHNICVGFRIANGYTVPSGIVFKPMIRLSSVSDATFAPYSNICPITGWTGLSGQRTGKNLLDATQNEAGGIDSTGVEVSGNVYRRSSNYIPIKPNTSFALWANNNWTVRLYWYDANKTFISPRASGNQGGKAIAVSPSNAVYARWSVYHADNLMTYEEVATSQLQLEVGSSASDFEAYQGETITCTWQTEAGTVYGGTVDVVTGVLTVTDAIVDLGTFNYTYQSTYERFYAAISNMKSYTMPRSVALLCSCFEAISDKREIDQVPYGAIYNGSGTNINIKIQGITDATAFKNYVTGQTLVYELATPQTYQLTPQQIETLIGNNTVFVDCGSVSVTYQASIKGYIDKVLGS